MSGNSIIEGERGMKPKCCYLPDQSNLEIGCENPVEYEICPEGKNWMDHYTHSCAEHLEKMLDDSRSFVVIRIGNEGCVLSTPAPEGKGNSMTDLQLEIGEWQDATFAGANALSKMSHLCKEVLELNKALLAFDHEEAIEDVESELADCQHLLFGIACKTGTNLYLATKAKFAINKKRKWGKPDENGVVEHLDSRASLTQKGEVG
jgi:NTP pyrophosphatase (non-canonical NTP hydrolase)